MSGNKKNDMETITDANELLNDEPIDIGYTKSDSEKVIDDSAEDIKRKAEEFAKAASGLASSLSKFAAKKSAKIIEKIDDEEFQEKVSSGFDSVADKIEDILVTGTVINVKGDGSIPIRDKADDISVDVQQIEETDRDIAAKDKAFSIEIEVMDDPEVYIVEGDLPDTEEKKSALEYLKAEIRERADENKELNARIEAERLRLKKIREDAKDANVFRKIKFVDNAISKKEIDRDNKVIAEIETEERGRISAARSERSKEIARKNKKPIAAFAAALVAAACGLAGVTTISNNIAEAKDYSAAVEYIMAEDYDNAKSQLSNVEKDDSDALYHYADYQSDIDYYKGRPDELLERLESVRSEISNEDVAGQCKTAIEEVTLADKIQDEIDSLDISSVESISTDKVKDIEIETKDLDERYQGLLDTDKYTLASKVLYNVENKTAAGMLISDIDEIGDVTLDSKNSIDKLRAAYNNLSGDDKETILNYTVLTSAEAQYKSLKKKEDERVAAEKKAAEEAAEAERKAAEEKAEQERLAAEAADKENSMMVWIPKTGKCYHSNSSCSGMKNPSKVSLSTAKSLGYRACSKCY